MIRKLLLVGYALAMGIVPNAAAQPVSQTATDHKAVKVDPKIFDGYEGRYQLGPNMILNITREGDRLYFQPTGQRRIEILPESDTEYFSTAPPTQVSFKTGDDGKATEIVFHQGGRDTLAQRVPGEPLKPRKSIALDSRILEKYVGRYQVPPARIFAVTLEDGHMFTQMTGQGKFEVLAETDHDFFVKDFDAQLTFHTDAQGTELVLHQGGDHSFQRIEEATAESLHSQLAEIDSMIAADFARRPVGSVTAGVIAGKQLIWSKSYGDADMEKKTPADQDTVYRIGSITKMFTALMLEQLVEAGKVHLSDPAEKYFPEINTVQGRFPDAPPITLIQLATHTSGLGREPDNTDTYVTGAVEVKKELLATDEHG
jgi:hypothetical protein